VRVAEPSWLPYYRFGREPPLPAGSRLRIYAGNAAAEPEPNVIARFVAGVGEVGDLTLPADQPVDLRVVEPGMGPAHSRRFLPGGEFASLASVRVLRKRDGTGLFLLVPTGNSLGSELPKGQYRLRFTYRRDNRTADPDSLVLGQAGDSSPEVAVLDVPWSRS